MNTRKLIDLAEKALELAEHGDYANGNVAQGMDEGDVLSLRAQMFQGDWQVSLR